jgi:hypothetical protein
VEQTHSLGIARGHQSSALVILGAAGLCAIFILGAITTPPASAATPASTGAVTIYGADTYGNQQTYYSGTGYVKIMAGHTLTMTQRNTKVSAMENFTSAACDSVQNPAWTIGFGPSNGDFTHFCMTLPTSTDLYFAVNGTVGQTFNGNIYYSSQPTFMTNIPYHYASGKISTTAPSTGYAAAIDFNIAGLLGGASVFEMDNCYNAAAPSYNPTTQQITFTPTTTAGKSCNVAISEGGTLGNPYFVSIGGVTIVQGSGWSVSGSNVLINSTSTATPFIVSWTPASGGSNQPPSNGNPSSQQTTSSTTTPSSVIPIPALVVPTVNIPVNAVSYLLALIVALVGTGATVTILRKEELWVEILFSTIWAYVLADLMANFSGFDVNLNQLYTGLPSVDLLPNIIVLITSLAGILTSPAVIPFTVTVIGGAAFIGVAWQQGWLDEVGF